MSVNPVLTWQHRRWIQEALQKVTGQSVRFMPQWYCIKQSDRLSSKFHVCTMARAHTYTHAHTQTYHIPIYIHIFIHTHTSYMPICILSNNPNRCRSGRSQGIHLNNQIPAYNEILRIRSLLPCFFPRTTFFSLTRQIPTDQASPGGCSSKILHSLSLRVGFCCG